MNVEAKGNTRFSYGSAVRAEDLMRNDLSAVSPDDSVEAALEVLHRRGVMGVPVVDGERRLVGFLSETDVLRAVLPSYLEILAQDSFLWGEAELLARKFAGLRSQPVRDFMQSQPRSVQRETSLMNVADLMLRVRVKRIPVLDGEVLVGMIDRADLCEYLMDSGAES